MSDTTPATAMDAAFGDHLILDDPDEVADLLDQAAEANRHTPGLEGSRIRLPEQGQLIMTGDLHDEPRNLQRILKYAQLHQDPNRRLVLHEIVHGSNLINGRDLSIRTLTRVAALKAAYPEQVLLLQSNHELAQRNNRSILKGNVDVIDTFNQGLTYMFGEDASLVSEAFGRYVQSLPLAIQAPNGVMCCHSLPSAKYIDSFDPTVLDREPTEWDLDSTGPANRMVWGRHHTQAIADELAGHWHCDVFVMGHQPADEGYDVQGETMLILACDHEQGRILPINLDQTYSRDQLIEQLVPLNTIALDS
jgi:hypothetical protein